MTLIWFRRMFIIAKAHGSSQNLLSEASQQTVCCSQSWQDSLNHQHKTSHWSTSMFTENQKLLLFHSLLLLPNMLLERKSLFILQKARWLVEPFPSFLSIFVIYMVPVVLNILYYVICAWSQILSVSWAPFSYVEQTIKSNTESIHCCSLLGKYLKRWLNRNISQRRYQGWDDFRVMTQAERVFDSVTGGIGMALGHWHPVPEMSSEILLTLALTLWPNSWESEACVTAAYRGLILLKECRVGGVIWTFH